MPLDVTELSTLALQVLMYCLFIYLFIFVICVFAIRIFVRILLLTVSLHSGLSFPSSSPEGVRGWGGVGWGGVGGGSGYLMSPSSLESQGCHLIPLFYPLSCSYLPLLLFLSCPFFLLMSHSPDILKILHYFLLRNRVFSFVVVFWLLFSS